MGTVIVDDRASPLDNALIALDFGDKLGLLDFTDVQYRSPVHSHRVVIRGERGEIADLEARVMPVYGQPLTRAFTRTESGRYGNLFGYALEAMSCGDEVVAAR